MLTVHEVRQKDYGMYQCKASNTLGSVTTNVNLTTPSRPDAPLEVRVVNATHDTITIAWKPGFDGGKLSALLPLGPKLSQGLIHVTFLRRRDGQI